MEFLKLLLLNFGSLGIIGSILFFLRWRYITKQNKILKENKKKLENTLEVLKTISYELSNVKDTDINGNIARMRNKTL